MSATGQSPQGLVPLEEFYAKRGTPVPGHELVDAGEVPEPYRWLLAHCESMTSRLERFFDDTIHIRVIQKREFEEILARQVILVLDHVEEPVEYGAIKINLTLFSAEARRVIRESRRPFGGILRDFEIEYESRPRSFFRIEADDLMKVTLNLDGNMELYGRCNALIDQATELPLAEVVEILPPLEVRAPVAG